MYGFAISAAAACFLKFFDRGNDLATVREKHKEATECDHNTEYEG